MKSATLHGGTPCIETESQYSNYIKIEYSLVNGRGLTDLDKIVASLIHYYSRRVGGCTASNEHLAFLLEKTPKSISDSISRLTRKGVVSRSVYKTKNGSRRILKSLLTPNWAWNVPKQETQTIATPDFENATPEITDELSQNTECMHSANSGSEIIVQNKTQIKEGEKENSSSFEFSNQKAIIKQARALIEHELGEYDANEEKEIRSIDKWCDYLQDKQQPEEISEVILEYISQLIRIRKSEKYGRKDFWLSIPVNISSSFSYRLQIKNTAPTLTLPPEDEIRTKTTESLSKENPSTMKSVPNGPTWEGFTAWYRERLTRTSIETLDKLNFTFEDSQLTILDDLSDSLKMVIKKYFNEEISVPVEIFFRETKQNERSKEENPKLATVPDQGSVVEGERNEKDVSIPGPSREISKPTVQFESQEHRNFCDFMKEQSISRFLNHSSIKLNRPDLEIIRKIRISYDSDLEKIVVYDSLPEKLKNHIREFFYYHTERVIAIEFAECKFHMAA
ncbi:hypothetical protein [Leptospira santarosai]|uniref:hypothetical protein n=1 Tax=Leptospira santarosai TaxID=28183 RepID=UPI0024AF805D|nr:hypothetical protein [Leptospira santarosai]MDI7182830.1 hypothetical protein [Leptospira santarosai]